MEIRDPVHGPIEVSHAEKQVIDHPLVQRLRRIRQLGFSEITFPGATHTRFLHSIGAMHLAGLAFDAVSKDLGDFSADLLAKARSTVRLAALLHDLGHAPMSHDGESLLPLGRELPAIPDIDTNKPVTHEQMTWALILGAELSGLIKEAFADFGVEAKDVVSVLGGDFIEDSFEQGSISILPVMRQLISGELDVDRMDYLLRDSYFTGVTYGRFEKDWLLSHLGAHQVGDSLYLTLDASAIFAFEDFLLSRYHMFLMVYAHNKTQSYYRMLHRFLASEEGSKLRLPADWAEFSKCDDEWLIRQLTCAKNPWAQRIIAKKPLQLVVEGFDDSADALESVKAQLLSALPSSVDWVTSGVEFSHHIPGAGSKSNLFIRSFRMGLPHLVTPVEQYSDLYARQAPKKRVVRIFCESYEAQTVAELIWDKLHKLLGKSQNYHNMAVHG